MPSVTHRFEGWWAQNCHCDALGLGVTASAQRSSRCDQLDGVADFDAACPSDGSVQTELAAKAANDITQNAGISSSGHSGTSTLTRLDLLTGRLSPKLPLSAPDTWHLEPTAAKSLE